MASRYTLFPLLLKIFPKRVVRLCLVYSAPPTIHTHEVLVLKREKNHLHAHDIYVPLFLEATPLPTVLIRICLQYFCLRQGYECPSTDPVVEWMHAHVCAFFQSQLSNLPPCAPFSVFQTQPFGTLVPFWNGLRKKDTHLNCFILTLDPPRPLVRVIQSEHVKRTLAKNLLEYLQCIHFKFRKQLKIDYAGYCGSFLVDLVYEVPWYELRKEFQNYQTIDWLDKLSTKENIARPLRARIEAVKAQDAQCVREEQEYHLRSLITPYVSLPPPEMECFQDVLHFLATTEL